MKTMKHTYLFEEATWKASGFFIDENGNEFSVEGEAKILHRKEFWENEGSMRVLAEMPIELRNIYKITPFEESTDTTKWTSENPALGKLVGNFIIVGDSILSLYRTEDNKFTGTEYLKKVDDNLYLNRGVLMKGNTKVSSWAVELRK